MINLRSKLKNLKIQRILFLIALYISVFILGYILINIPLSAWVKDETARYYAQPNVDPEDHGVAAMAMGAIYAFFLAIGLLTFSYIVSLIVKIYNSDLVRSNIVERYIAFVGGFTMGLSALYIVFVISLLGPSFGLIIVFFYALITFIITNLIMLIIELRNLVIRFVTKVLMRNQSFK
jgi:hypothetical protein